MLAANIAIHTPVPAVYFSADSDEWTVKQRACSILSGTPLDLIESQLNEESWEKYYADLLHKADHVDWCYQTDIDPEFIGSWLLAYGEKWGDHPQFIVVDNIGNAVVDQDNEGSELRALCRDLQRVARNTNAHVMGLCHVKGPKENGDKAILLADLLYNLGKVPEVVLGLHREGPQKLYTLTVPKYRGGKGGQTIALGVDYTTARVGGFR